MMIWYSRTLNSGDNGNFVGTLFNFFYDFSLIPYVFIHFHLYKN